MPTAKQKQFCTFLATPFVHQPFIDFVASSLPCKFNPSAIKYKAQNLFVNLVLLRNSCGIRLNRVS